jgi:hypothetical protein
LFCKYSFCLRRRRKKKKPDTEKQEEEEEDRAAPKKWAMLLKVRKSIPDLGGNLAWENQAEEVDR